jgi:hypothetical protein
VSLNRQTWSWWLVGAGLLTAGVASLITDTLPNPRADPRYEMLKAASVFSSALLLVAYALWMRTEWRDPRHGMTYAAYLTLSMLLFIASHTGSEAYARVVVAGQTPGAAIGNAFSSMLTQPLMSCELFIPFILLGWSAAPMSKARGAMAGAAVFVLGGILFAWIYLSGHLDSQSALLQRKWTASALTMGFAFLQSLIVGVVLFLICTKVVSTRRGNDT